jgi:hypothetical protein
MILKAWKSKGMHWHLVRAVVLHHPMVEGRREREGKARKQQRLELTFITNPLLI